MRAMAEVFEISSDEEEGCRRRFENRDTTGEVVFVGEFLSRMDKKCSTLVNPKKRDREDDLDDDCLVLDGDPDEGAVLLGDDRGGGGSNDLVIVKEKGQTACRDYPHPRHLCANFPFSTSPHEKYCKMCHCYVCDTPAPCTWWGTGVSTADHCQSTDKEERWKMMRRLTISRKNPRMANPSLPEEDPSLPIPARRIVQVSPIPLPTTIPTHPSLRPCLAVRMNSAVTLSGTKSTGQIFNQNSYFRHISRTVQKYRHQPTPRFKHYHRIIRENFNALGSRQGFGEPIKHQVRLQHDASNGVRAWEKASNLETSAAVASLVPEQRTGNKTLHDFIAELASELGVDGETIGQSSQASGSTPRPRDNSGSNPNLTSNSFGVDIAQQSSAWHPPSPPSQPGPPTASPPSIPLEANSASDAKEFQKWLDSLKSTSGPLPPPSTGWLDDTESSWIDMVQSLL